MNFAISGSDIKEALQLYKEQLCNWLDPLSDLLDELVAGDVLTRQEREEIKSERTVFSQNKALIETMANKMDDEHLKFAHELIMSNQAHIVNHLKSRG